MIAIQGTYTKVTTALAVPNEYSVNPFDLYGNLLTEMTIEVNSTLAACTIFLPKISTLSNNWNTKINVISLTGATFSVVVKPFDVSNIIGSNNLVTLSQNGASIELSPITLINWAANITA